MSDKLRSFEAVAARARKASSPVLDVSKEVIVAIQSRNPDQESSLIPILAFATAATLAAVLVGGAAYSSWPAAQDPMIALFEPVHLVMN